MTKPVLKFKKLDPRAVLPKYETPGAAGMDVRVIVDEPVAIAPGKAVTLRTGLAVEIPFGYEIQVRPRSGLAFKNGLTVANSPGTLDSDWRGENLLRIVNHSTEWFWVENEMRMAQFVLAPVEQAEIIEVDELSSTERGEGGFGSTGVK